MIMRMRMCQDTRVCVILARVRPQGRFLEGAYRANMKGFFLKSGLEEERSYISGNCVHYSVIGFWACGSFYFYKIRGI